MRLQRAHIRFRDVGDAFLDHEGQRDRARAHADMHRHFVMLQDVADLLSVVAGEEVRAGERRAVDAGLEQHPPGEPRVDMQVRALDRDHDIGIVGVDAGGLSAARGDAKPERIAATLAS